MYTTFIFSFTELTTAIPHAGGPFAYSYRAFGPLGGFIAGFATLIEFVFAPPVITSYSIHYTKLYDQIIGFLSVHVSTLTSFLRI